MNPTPSQPFPSLPFGHPGGARKAAAQYQTVSLESGALAGDRHRLIAMLYDGVLNEIAQAQTALASRDYARKGLATNKALRILDEGLRAALDPTHAPELAGNLDALYEYCHRRLLEAHVANDAAAYQEVAQLLGGLRDAWNQIRTAT